MKRIVIVIIAVVCCCTMVLAGGSNTASYNLQRGVELIQNGEWEEAIEYLQKARRQNPHSGYAELFLAFANGQLGEAGNMMSYLEEALKYLPKSDKSAYSWAYGLKADLYIHLGDTLEALNNLNHSVKLQPKECDWYATRGRLLRDMKRWKEAEADFKKIISLEPKSARGYYLLGSNMLAQEQYAEAKVQLERALDLGEESYYYSSLAKCNEKLGQYEDAAGHIIMALDMEPGEDGAVTMIQKCQREEFTTPLINKLEAKIKKAGKEPEVINWYIYEMFTYEGMKNYEEAIRVCNRAKKATANPNVDYFKSEYFMDMGDFVHALECINQAIEVDTADNNYLLRRHYIYKELEYQEKMIADIDKLIERVPDKVGYYEMRASMYLDMREYQKAIEDYDIALALDHTADHARYARARCLAIIGDTIKANKEYQRLYEQCNDSSVNIFVMAMMGKHDEAKQMAESLLTVDSLANNRYNLACVYALIGERELAMKELELALEQGFVNFNGLISDIDLDSLKGDEMDKLIEKYRTICRERIAKFEENK